VAVVVEHPHAQATPQLLLSFRVVRLGEGCFCVFSGRGGSSSIRDTLGELPTRRSRTSRPFVPLAAGEARFMPLATTVTVMSVPREKDRAIHRGRFEVTLLSRARGECTRAGDVSRVTNLDTFLDYGITSELDRRPYNDDDLSKSLGRSRPPPVESFDNAGRRTVLDRSFVSFSGRERGGRLRCRQAGRLGRLPSS
jgi:hypothetical protein